MAAADAAPGATEPEILDVVIIGAGVSGLCMAHQLQKQGIRSFRVLERGTRVGGTWRDNTYPGLCCDVPSHFYCYSFELNPRWSKVYPEQYEILEYLEHVATKYGLHRYIQFGCEVDGARFDEPTGTWEVTTKAGEIVRGRTLVSGLGQLNKPKWPDVKGRDSFAGHSFHSFHWDHDYDLAGKRVAVIGNGPTAVGFVPIIAKEVAELTIFQRSANWVIPKPDREYTRWERWAFAHVPGWPRLYRWYHAALQERNFLAFSERSSRLGTWFDGLLARVLSKNEMTSFADVFEAGARAELEAQIPDPELRERLTPDYPIGCKRIIPTNDYLPTMMRENVTVVTDAVSEIVPDGIVTADGQQRAFDAIIYATGFDSTRFVSPVEITGLDGVALEDVWKNGAEAYRGVSVPGFPNFFMCYGPNTNTGHISIIYMIESQVSFIVRCVKELRERGLRYVDVKDDAMSAYNAEIGRDLERTVWAADCESWYKTADGKITNNWPGFGYEYQRLMARFEPDELRLVQ